MKHITLRNAKHTVRWMVDPGGLILTSTPEDDYTGCWVVDFATLKPGELASYQTPDRKRTIQLQLPITHVVNALPK